MAQAIESEVREIVLANSSFGPHEVEQIARTIADDFGQLGILRDAVHELERREDSTPASAVRLGVCQYLLGRNQLALATLDEADGGAMAQFYRGRALAALQRYPEATECYQKAAQAGYDKDICQVFRAESVRLGGDPRAALEILDGLFGPVESSAEYLAQRAATVASLGENPGEAIALYERALQTDRNHVVALFGLARENDRYGNDEEALRLYQRAAARIPTHVGVLLNLGLIHEDRLEFDKAQGCYLRILDAEPTHPRAKLYLKDAQASGDMYYDEEAQRQRDRMAQVLNMPVSDFELSVRSRNCLQKMGIRTLGDLTRVSEQQLLASKNFGETSLIEIRDILGSKGLELGQFAHERAEPEPQIDTSTLTPDEQSMLDRGINELNLSVRARKCMIRLGLATIGELLRKTGDELLECKNFGVTSLNEVREKLRQYGLKLRGD